MPRTKYFGMDARQKACEKAADEVRALAMDTIRRLALAPDVEHAAALTDRFGPRAGARLLRLWGELLDNGGIDGHDG